MERMTLLEGSVIGKMVGGRSDDVCSGKDNSPKYFIVDGVLHVQSPSCIGVPSNE